ncbi:sugar dehydrogenase complex small subunit [Janthinobacterium sp. HLX7-2]|uniref:sugar dehydrogenase complex small subunit n=1 Tax=Janthinobacterium sp. HLX7-2 TaxID=1259331 RepID=UPI003F274661
MDATNNKGKSPFNPGRRMVLAGLLSASAAALIPWALAEPVADAEQGAFLAVSAVLVGRQVLEPGLATRIYKALVAQDAAFPANVRALLTLINAEGLTSANIQAALDAAESKLAAVPRQIASGWYLGIVGTGEAAVCVAYEEALNAAVVADVLVPPTYSYGAYGSWARKPI